MPGLIDSLLVKIKSIDYGCIAVNNSTTTHPLHGH